MGHITALVNVSLDGVMQAPARPDEDIRGSFTQGGWAAPYAAMEDVPKAMTGVQAMLFGRRTYQDFQAAWSHRTDTPFAAFFDNIRKYVVSTTLTDPLPWENSTLIGQDVIPALNSVKAAQPGGLVIMGSGALIRSLLPHAVIDRLVLLIHPLVLGHGQRVFPDGGPSLRWQLTAGRSTSRGVFAATCDRPAQV